MNDGIFKKSKGMQISEITTSIVDDFMSPLDQKAASKDWLKKNAANILKNSGITLTNLIAKAASENDLNPEEVCRIVEESNKETFDRLFKISEDKAVEFDVADPREVFRQTDTEYDPGYDMFFRLETPKEAMSKKASAPEIEGHGWAHSALRPTHEQKRQAMYEMAKQAKEVVEELKFDSSADMLAATSEIYKMAKQMVLQKDATLDELMCIIGEGRKWDGEYLAHANSIFEKVALATGTKLSPLNQIHKTAADKGYGPIGEGIGAQFDPMGDYVAEIDVSSPPARCDDIHPGAQFSHDRPVKVINGNHKLFMLLDTLVDQSHKDKVFEKGTLMAGDEVRYMKRGVVNWKGKTESMDQW